MLQYYILLTTTETEIDVNRYGDAWKASILHSSNNY